MFIHRAPTEETNKVVTEPAGPSNPPTRREEKFVENDKAKPITKAQPEQSSLPEHDISKERPDVIELEDCDILSPFSDYSKDQIQFHRSPRNIEEVEFIEKLSNGKNRHKRDAETLSPKVNSVEDVLSNIPKEYFRIERKYESIDAVLDHINQRREKFMSSISPSRQSNVSKTLEPVMNPVSPIAKEFRDRYSKYDLYDNEQQAEVVKKQSSSLKRPKQGEINMFSKSNEVSVKSQDSLDKNCNVTFNAKHNVSKENANPQI